MNEKVYNAAIALLMRLEGLRILPYRCSANKLTIGYGHIIKPSECIIYKGWKKPQFVELLRKDFNVYFTGVQNALSALPHPLSDCEVCALTLFAYNCGVSRVSVNLFPDIEEFVLKRMAHSSDTLPSRARLFSKMKQYCHYHDKDGKVQTSLGLLRRRMLEIEFFKGTLEPTLSDIV